MPDETENEPVEWFKLPPVLPVRDVARRLQAMGLPPQVALLTAGLIAVEDIHAAIEGWPERDWEFPMEDFVPDFSRETGCALLSTGKALRKELCHYHLAAARRWLLAEGEVPDGN